MIPAAPKRNRFVGDASSIRFGAHQLPAHIRDALKKEKTLAKNCGTGSGGFEAGNDCAAGDGSGGGGTDSGSIAPEKLLIETISSTVQENGDILVNISFLPREYMEKEIETITRNWQGETIEQDVTRSLAKEVVESGAVSETYIKSAQAYCLDTTGQDILEMQAATRLGETEEEVFRSRLREEERVRETVNRVRIGTREPSEPPTVEQTNQKVAQLVDKFNLKRDPIIADARTKLPREMVVHRGLVIETEVSESWAKSLKAGDSLDAGVISTSQNPRVASRYGRVGEANRGSIVLKITTSRGMVGQASAEVDAFESNNQEIVLAPKSIRIKSVQKIRTRRDVDGVSQETATSYLVDCEAVY